MQNLKTQFEDIHKFKEDSESCSSSSLDYSYEESDDCSIELVIEESENNKPNNRKKTEEEFNISQMIQKLNKLKNMINKNDCLKIDVDKFNVFKIEKKISKNDFK